MALTVNEANTVSMKYYDKALVQTCYDNSALYQKLKKMKQVVSGGVSITWPIRYQALSRADAVGANDRVVFEKKATRTQAVLDWKYYLVDMLITWEERTKNTGPQQIVKLIGDKATEGKEDMDDRMATDLFTTNPNGDGYTSLATIVDDADDYAGIAVSDAAAWAAIEDSTTTELTLFGATTTLSGMVGQATYGKWKPDFHLTTKLLRDKFESLLEPKQRYTSDEMASLGFSDTVMFHGAPVMGDSFCTSGDWYGLTLKDNVYYCYHPDFNFTVTDWKELFQAGYPYHLAKTLAWAGNLKSRARRCHFKYTALDASL